MRTAFALAALAGCALAAPQYGQHKEEIYTVENVDVVVQTVVQTVYVTDGGYDVQPAAATSTSMHHGHRHHTTTTSVVYQAPSTSVVYQAPPAQTSAVYQPPAESSYVAPEPAKPTSTPAPAPTSSGYMAVVDTWRSKLGKKALIHDDTLEANALNCVTESNGQMVHKLNPGSFGQVLAPGNANDFEHVFVGGWLCEMPNLPGLDGVCSSESSGWSYEGQTGHAKILTDDSYSKIGCALYAGIWGCDVA